ncbi:biotin--[acetyl-CoA-carboxylase] ligase [Clostridium sp. SYSU_GA19001]|uniref:biotin--[acetyl-CoA-carboxylase] ligase n=1 Tax=Clostridium caldaquaticum TaxID=2940653 RepID=UPI00207759FA|nr:biotin--[acetyl-CoA-carboxylase] ligase [Clostridium caldaquaticum]MCM8711177.1 biotin--[acetyl-CoA-carboxylase] ligase [Clostridium caldaquaticum]
MKNEILKLLKKNPDSFVSGQSISDYLKVSRTAIWKYMNGLREDGYKIESVSNKGYKLLSSPDLLTFEEIEPYLNTNFIGRNIIHFNSIDSTNIKAKKLADSIVKDGTIVIAEEQTSGKGRLGRNWISPQYKGIWMSIILKPDLNPIEAVKLTQIAAAAVVTGTEEFGIKTYIKWPNDIVINHKKVCGILTEMNAELTRINYVIVGIGINVNIDETEFPGDIKHIATSLKIESKKSINRQKLAGNILNNFEKLYVQFVKQNDLSSSINICRENSALIGKNIIIINRETSVEAKAIDIDEDGRLLVEYKDGRRESLISGEISIRGKESYI